MFNLLDESLGFIINKTALAMKYEFEKKLAPLDITAAQYQVLKRLSEEDGLSQKEIAQRTFKTYAETTRVLDRLEAKKFLTRNPSPNDRREFIIRLTSSGHQNVNEATKIAHSILATITKGFSKDEITAIIASLNTIYTNLENIKSV